MMPEIEGRGFLADASVVVKWCLGVGESSIPEAQVFLDAHLDGNATGHLLDLTAYEVGNALTHYPYDSSELAAVMAPLTEWELSILPAFDPSGIEITFALVRAYDLTFYDASYLAAARVYGMPLVTDDYALLDAAKAEGLGIGLADIA